MNKRFTVTLGIFSFAVCAFAQNTRTIQVDVAYTGSGTVDAGHKIYVALWSSPQLNGNPVSVKSLETKKGIVIFTDVQNVPAYVSTAFDPTGRWDAQSPPPSGSSLGMYAAKPPTADPIDVAVGKTAKVKITFDDTHKVP